MPMQLSGPKSYIVEARGAQRHNFLIFPACPRRPSVCTSARPCGGRLERGKLASMAPPKLKHDTPAPNAYYESLS